MKDFKDFKDFNDFKDFKDFKDFTDFKDFKDFRDFKDFKDFKDFQDFEDFEDFEDFKDFQDFKDFKDLRSQPSGLRDLLIVNYKTQFSCQVYYLGFVSVFPASSCHHNILHHSHLQKVSFCILPMPRQTYLKEDTML